MQNKKVEIESVGEQIATIIAFVLNIALGVFTTYYLWNNIMAHLFALPVLTAVQAYAVDLFISYVVPFNKSNDGMETLERLMFGILKTLFFLGLGFMVIQFI